jgi:anti-anti-sigma regulatory factor
MTSQTEAAGTDNVVSPPAREPLALPQVLDLTAAQDLRDSMIRLSTEHGILLDASGVERMSTPCIQVLLAAGRAVDISGKSFKIVRASDVFRTAIADLGLHAEFSNWMN